MGDKSDIKRFQEFLSGHGLAVADTNTYLRRLDKKVFVDPAIAEHREVEEHVCSFVGEFVKGLPDLNLTPIKSGSYYSNLRVGRPYEFDFMLEIPMSNVKVTQVKGEMKDTAFYDVRIPETDDLEWLENISPLGPLLYECYDGETLHVGELMDCLGNTFTECLTNLEDVWHLKRYEHKPNSPAVEVIMMYKDNPILLDLVPCLRFPSEQEEEMPEINQDLCELVLRIIKDNPENIFVFGNSQNDFTEPLTKETVLKLMHQNLYLVFSNDMLARLSTSMIEKFIFQGIKDDFLAVLRLLKYLVQTFHIPISSYPPSYLDMSSVEYGAFGLSSAIASRYLTMAFLQFVFFEGQKSNTTETTDQDNLGCYLFGLLEHIKFFGLPFINERSITSIFPGVNTGPVKTIRTSPVDEIFHTVNIDTIINFLLMSIKEDSMDNMCMICPENHVRCQECWGADIDGVLDHYKIGRAFPEKRCYMHDYLNQYNDCKIQVYNQDLDCKILVYNKKV